MNIKSVIKDRCVDMDDKFYLHLTINNELGIHLIDFLFTNLI